MGRGVGRGKGGKLGGSGFVKKKSRRKDVRVSGTERKECHRWARKEKNQGGSKKKIRELEDQR
ncbi:hypothetical protein, partial [Clostridium sp. ZBS12]|uniref:hypothetical protein n=1 Tax=Clostridium sp. ZBS12 TaxID=2949972 RepID=UPI00207A4110